LTINKYYIASVYILYLQIQFILADNTLCVLKQELSQNAFPVSVGTIYIQK